MRQLILLLLVLLLLMACKQQTANDGLPENALMQQRVSHLTTDNIRHSYQALSTLKVLDSQADSECSEKLPLAEQLAQQYPTQWLVWKVQWQCLRELEQSVDQDLHTDSTGFAEQVALSKRVETMRLWLVDQMDQLEASGDGRYPETGMRVVSLYDAYSYIKLLGQSIYDQYLSAHADGQLLIFHVLSWDSDAQQEIHWHFDLRLIQDALIDSLSDSEYCRYYPSYCVLSYFDLPGFDSARRIGFAELQHTQEKYDEATELLQLASSESAYAALRLADLKMLNNNYDYVADEVLSLINQAINHGVVDAEIIASILMEHDYVIKQDQARAIEFMHSAADQLPAGEAEFRRALWMEGAGLDGLDPIAAYQRAIDKGSATAMREMGRNYFQGFGVAQNKQTGIDWLLQAANLGDREAQADLGDAFYLDEQFQDIDLADYWLRRAAKQNHPVALMQLGYLLDEYPQRASGQDDAFAYTWLAAQLGQETAQNNYAYYIENNKVQADYQTMLDLYTSAAEHGETLAYHAVGYFAENNPDGASDYLKARHWYQRSADEGHQKGKLALARLRRAGLGGAINYQKPFNTYTELATAGVEQAYIPLAEMYLNGEGIETNPEQARQWLQRAVAAGYEGALDILDERIIKKIGKK